MIKRAKDHVSAAFHSAPFQGQPPTGGTQRQTERAIYANVEEAETCERKHTYNARNRLMHPKVGGAKGLGLCFCFCSLWGLSSFLSRTLPFEGFSLRCRLFCHRRRLFCRVCLQLLHFLQLLSFFVSLCCFECRLPLEFNLLSV